MALSASGIFEINSAATASNVNPGYFNPANANMATDLTTDDNTANTNSPVCSSASYNFVAGDVGHRVYVKSGTDWTPGWYLIASVASNKATLSAAVGEAEQESNRRIITNTVAGCATVGTPTNGTWTIDYSRSTASPFASTDLASANGTTNPSAITSATNPFTIAMVGNGLRVTAGTNWTVAWHEIVSVSGTTATIDKAAGAAASISSGTGKVGGALSLASTFDDDLFELILGTDTAAMRWFVKNGTYTLGEAVGVANDITTKSQACIEGYATMRGDRPTGSTRPTFATGANGITINGAGIEVRSLIITGTASPLTSFGNNSRIFNVKAVNSSSTAARVALGQDAANITFIDCEGISYRGIGITQGPTHTNIIGGFYHDSDVGVKLNGHPYTVQDVLIANNVTAAIDITQAPTSQPTIQNCTLYGAEDKLGIGLKVLSTSVRINFINNIIYGFVTGVDFATACFSHYDDHNNYYNNTTDVTAAANWQKGANDIALDPQFTSVQQRTGSTATTTAGNHLVQAGATFQTWGVTAGTHYLRLVSGTGVTAGYYGIASVDSETQITTDITLSANATADKVWAIVTGLDWSVGTNMKAEGLTGAFHGSSTTSYFDLGAAQRQEAGGVSGGSFTFAG